jgi:hypothetical protein
LTYSRESAATEVIVLLLFHVMCDLLQVRADKQREAIAGHDGSWVAHPALVTIAMEQYNKYMPQVGLQFELCYISVTLTAAENSYHALVLQHSGCCRRMRMLCMSLSDKAVTNRLVNLGQLTGVLPLVCCCGLLLSRSATSCSGAART